MLLASPGVHWGMGLGPSRPRSPACSGLPEHSDKHLDLPENEAQKVAVSFYAQSGERAIPTRAAQGLCVLLVSALWSLSCLREAGAGAARPRGTL